MIKFLLDIIFWIVAFYLLVALLFGLWPFVGVPF